MSARFMVRQLPTRAAVRFRSGTRFQMHACTSLAGPGSTGTGLQKRRILSARTTVATLMSRNSTPTSNMIIRALGTRLHVEKCINDEIMCADTMQLRSKFQRRNLRLTTSFYQIGLAKTAAELLQIARCATPSFERYNDVLMYIHSAKYHIFSSSTILDSLRRNECNLC